MQEVIEVIIKNKEVLFYCFILLILILFYTIIQIYIRMGVFRATVLIVGTFILILFLAVLVLFTDQDLRERYPYKEVNVSFSG